MGAGATAGAVAAAGAAIANAVKASGAIVKVEPGDFQKIMAKTDKTLVVRAIGGLISKNFQYLTAYKGLVFYTKSPSELSFPSDVEIILAKKIWVPD